MGREENHKDTKIFMIEIIDLKDRRTDPRLEAILGRSLALDPELLKRVAEIIEMVRTQGDKALSDLTERLDGVRIDPAYLKAGEELIKELASVVDEKTVGFLREAIENVRVFHAHQLEHSWEFTDSDGVTLGQRISPLDTVGLYVPGGKAAYPSTLIMNAVPALTAGVKRIVVTTPPGSFKTSPIIAATLNELRISEVYTVGGAQAIAALAYGTETIPKVDKIVGPGNLYVAAAKKLVFGVVDIDSIAGPSEIVVLADDTASADFIAADLLSQAEHDSDAAAILVTTNRDLAEEVQKEIVEQLSRLPRREIATAALSRYGAIFIVGSLEQGCDLINRIAPEHVELMVEKTEEAAGAIPHAGAIFFGPYSCEAAGDYMAGPNHVLPTGGTARFSSPLGVYDFLKRTNIIKYNKEKLEKTVEAIAGLAEREGLAGHARAATIRFKEKTTKTQRHKEN
jgi:histidinol dehydrogenase